jgi:hypothetical protein
MGIANHRVPRTGDLESDRIGYIRRSLTHRERQSIKSKAEWRNSARGRSHLEIKKREEESTTSQEEWENMEIEKREVVTNPNEATNGGQHTGTHTSETNKSEAELAHAKNELDKLTAKLAEADKWRAEQEAINRAREDKFEKDMEASKQEKARKLAASKNENGVTQTVDNASDNSAKGC